ncbi:hypothetical protein BGZ98_007276, partial [Dissophora globulifera]
MAVHIIQCYGVDRDANHVSIITDYAEGGNLDDAALRLDWEDKKRIVVEVARGLAYLHSQDIIHRDIKGGNILLTKHDEVKLCDFGIAKIIASATCASSYVRKGTTGFMAPELMRARPAYSKMSDVYALGVVMKKLVCKDPTPPDYEAMMNKCLNEHPEKRPTAEEIVGAFQVVYRLDNIDESDQVKMEQGPSANEEFGLGCLLYFKSKDETDRAEGVQMLLRSAHKGHLKAQAALGHIYQSGVGVLRDYTKAAEWLQMAADKGYVPAQTELGMVGVIGKGVEKNYEEAIQWLRLAAEGGSAKAQLLIGLMYYHGVGTGKDYTESKNFILMAASQGVPEAHNILGKMHHFGRGVPQDDREAIKWLLKAADGGHADAQYIISLQFSYGNIVRKNPSRGRMWLKKAAEQGHLNARSLLKAIDQELSDPVEAFGCAASLHNTIRWMKYITLVEKIGHGGQAEVFKAKYVLDDVVIKLFLNPDDKDWRREIEFAKQVRYRHIVQFYHMKHDMFMMEFVEGGSLSNAILMGSTEDWETKIRIAKQVSLGLTYLHGQNILHCDIKSANILLTKNLDVKICDFGRARMIGQSGRDGTLPWMAPELFLEPPQYSCKSDVYALGMVMWEMASGCTQPYQEHLPESMVHCIVNGITEDIPSNTPEEYTACIQACWHQHPEERPAATEIFPDIDEISQDHDIDDLQALGDELDKKIQFPEAVGRNDESEYSMLGGIYYDGLGVRKNYKKSMEWYLKASNAGDSSAMIQIGEMYRNSQGVEQDYVKAMEWYLKASDAGDSRAKVIIGEMYRNGHGVEQDYTKAME